MAFETIKFEDISASHLLDLVDNNVAESRTLEYKAAMYGRDDQGKKEALKDITALANSDGGHLIIGIAEKDGALALDGIQSASVDTEIQRLESLLRDGVEPRLIGYQIRAIPVSSNRNAIIVHIPRSWTKPHRTNSKHFYVRNSNGVHEVSVNELRTLFLSGQTEMDRIRRFMEDRIGALAAGNGILPLKAANLVAVHMVPVLGFLANDQIDIKKLKENPRIFSLIYHDINRSRPNLDGFCNGSYPDDGKYEAYTQIFRNGAMEAVLSGIVRDSPEGYIAIGAWVIKDIVASIAQYEKALIENERLYPFAVFVSLIGAKGAYLRLGTDRYHPILPLPIDRDILTLPESILDQQPGSAELAALRLKGTLDALWNAGGKLSVPILTKPENGFLTKPADSARQDKLTRSASIAASPS